MSAPALLRMTGIRKAYPGVQALGGVDFELQAGQVHALLGENGAGKSTLIKILAGAVAPDAGSIQLDGVHSDLLDPAQSQRAGIVVIHQEFMLVPTLSVRDNIFLGGDRIPGRLEKRRERLEVLALFERLGVQLDPESRCSSLSVAQQQLVEIAKALSKDARILVMDEPSAALSGQEVQNLLRIVGELRERGLGIIYITHRLKEVEQVADQVSVLRDGNTVYCERASTGNRESWIEAMVGRSIDQEYPPRLSRPRGEPVLSVRGLRGRVSPLDVSFDLHRGEILGLTGLVGAGRSELASHLIGEQRPLGGTITLAGRPLAPRSPRQAIEAGLCLLPEDRKGQGLLLARSVVENFALGNGASLSTKGWIRSSYERQRLEQQAGDLQLTLNDMQRPAVTLSGGNQQKLLLARWLERGSEVLILDEPTRGIDVGARYEIYSLIQELARQGRSVLMISSDLSEVLGVCDRVLVMREGRLVADCENDASLTQERVMAHALGVPEQKAS